MQHIKQLIRRLKQKSTKIVNQEQLNEYLKKLFLIENMIKGMKGKKYKQTYSQRQYQKPQYKQENEQLKQLKKQKHLEEMKMFFIQAFKQKQMQNQQMSDQQLQTLNQNQIMQQKKVENLQNQLQAQQQGTIEMKQQYQEKLNQLRGSLIDKLNLSQVQEYQKSLENEKKDIEQQMSQKDWRATAIQQQKLLDRKQQIEEQLQQSQQQLQQQQKETQQIKQKVDTKKQKDDNSKKRNKLKNEIKSTNNTILKLNHEIEELEGKQKLTEKQQQTLSKKKESINNLLQKMREQEDNMRKLEEEQEILRIQPIDDDNAEGNFGYGMTHDEVDQIGHKILKDYNDVIFANQQFKNKNQEIEQQIINDNHHYKAWIIDKKNQNVCWYDPFGNPPTKEQLEKLLKMCKGYEMKIKINTKQTQPDTSDLCGLHCLFFLKKYQETNNFKYSTNFTEKDVKKYPKFETIENY